MREGTRPGTRPGVREERTDPSGASSPKESAVRRHLTSLHIPVLTLVALAPLVALAACNSTRTLKGTDVVASEPAKLEARAPIDIAVLPVVNNSKRKGVPAKELRGAFELALIQRRYSPLASEFVDGRVVEAGYRPGALKEDAALTVTVESWDDSLWDSHTAVTVTIHASITDAAGAELWKGQLTQRFDLGKDRESYSTDAPLRAALSNKIAGELLAALPARPAKPGHAN